MKAYFYHSIRWTLAAWDGNWDKWQRDGICFLKEARQLLRRNSKQQISCHKMTNWCVRLSSSRNDGSSAVKKRAVRCVGDRDVIRHLFLLNAPLIFTNLLLISTTPLIVTNLLQFSTTPLIFTNLLLISTATFPFNCPYGFLSTYHGSTMHGTASLAHSENHDLQENQYAAYTHVIFQTVCLGCCSNFAVCISITLFCWGSGWWYGLGSKIEGRLKIDILMQMKIQESLENVNS